MGLKSINQWLDKYSLRILLLFILVTGMAYCIVEVIQIFNTQDYNININVTGIVNATNSTISLVQLDCIKYCIDNVETNYDYQGDCMDRCLKIGETK